MRVCADGHVCMRVCMCADVHVQVCACVHMCMCVQMRTCLRVCRCACVCMCADMYMCVCVCRCARVCMSHVCMFNALLTEEKGKVLAVPDVFIRLEYCRCHFQESQTAMECQEGASQDKTYEAKMNPQHRNPAVSPACSPQRCELCCLLPAKPWCGNRCEAAGAGP